MAFSDQARRLLKGLVSPRRGNLVLLRFKERGADVTAWCPDDETFTLARELILDRVYERRGVRLTEGLGTVVDAGAHAGIFSLQASKWADRVIALEPDPVNYSLLRLNLERNRATNVSARQCALWKESTPSLPFEGTHHTGGGSVAAGAGAGAGAGEGAGAGVGAEGKRTVAAVSLDDLVEEVGVIDLLKIDIEGAEYPSLSNARSIASVRRIVGEIHLDDADDRRLDDLVALLTREGFTVDVVKERELYGAGGLRRLRANRSALSGNHLAKVLAAAYLLAPVRKPIRSPGATYELPILVATRGMGSGGNTGSDRSAGGSRHAPTRAPEDHGASGP